MLLLFASGFMLFLERVLIALWEAGYDEACFCFEVLLPPVVHDSGGRQFRSAGGEHGSCVLLALLLCCCLRCVPIFSLRGCRLAKGSAASDFGRVS